MKFCRVSLYMTAIVLFSCKHSEVKDQVYLFEGLTSKVTNLDFNNELIPDEKLNIMTYLYYFNGGGVGCGDFNNDGLVDLFFTGSIVPSKIYLNTGSLKFRDVTKLSGIDTGGGWSTGVSVIDINNDGLLDIYVNQVGSFRDFSGRNRLFVCSGIKDGVPQYSEQAETYGLDFRGLATQSLFFDYDLDGDLDLYQMNHSVHENGTFGERRNFLSKIHKTSGDKLFRNDGTKFIDVTAGSGIHSMVIGYGLGIASGDVNNDGWPDLYIGNDFHENDYLYINQKNGTFREQLTEQMTHTSRFSMGVDIADFNNDGHDDIVSLDMQPYDPVVLKSSLGEDEYSAFMFKLTYGYSVQFARNNLQLNNGDDTFSEIGMYAGVHATDWSWSSLFMDFDNDGFKDLFITNGIPARMNDIDYVNFRTGNEDHKWKTQGNRMEHDDLEIIKRIPEIKFPNKFFKNSGDNRFAEINSSISGNLNTFSNGAVYADLDNDGDLDVVVNNINDAALVYRNLSRENGVAGDFINFRFEGSDKNRNGIGARVIVFKDSSRISYEHNPVRGFQSSMNTNMLVGVGDTATVDSAVIIWPDRRFQKLDRISFNNLNVLKWDQSLPFFDYSQLKGKSPSTHTDITSTTGLDFRHEENNFIEFDRERLIPFMVSTEGPAVAVADINGDGLEDVFFGSSKWERSRLYVQTMDGKLEERTPAIIMMDSTYEDVDAVFEDIDNDGDKDLIVAAGGNEFWGESPNLKQRFYLNDGKGVFYEKGFFPGAWLTASCILAHDFDKDGLVDFFIGGRAVPKAYGEVPESYLFRNMGKGKFEDITDQVSKKLKTAGMVTGGSWTDINNDGDKDLVLTVEWDQIKIFEADGGTFNYRPMTAEKGLWNFIFPVDGDQDGDVDFIAGNAGLNTKFQVNADMPLRLYVNDYDDNGQTEQILTYFVDGREIPFATHAELTKQLPFLKKKYLYAKDFAEASISELFGSGKLERAAKYEVTSLANAYIENKGNFQFVTHELPGRLQFSSLQSAALIREESRSGQGKMRLFLGGNFYENNIDMGWYNASYGDIVTISKNNIVRTDASSLGIRGQIRNIKPIVIAGKLAYLFVRNNDSCILLRPATDETINQ